MTPQDKIEELEKRIRDLEARPLTQPVYIPYPVTTHTHPYQPLTSPYWTYPSRPPYIATSC